MKNFLKKLHIGDTTNAAAPSAPPPPPPPRKLASNAAAAATENKHLSGISNWLNSVTGRQSPPAAPSATAVAAAAAAEARDAMEREMAARESESVRERERERETEEERKREKEEDELEEYQIQLALEMSAREDPEAMQIEVAKQISLGSCPVESSPAEVVAYRYWKFNALSYDDKILDGFYDLYGGFNESTSVTMPSLTDLQAKPFSHRVNWEAVLVNRAVDAELVNLEQKALVMGLDIRSQTSDFVGGALIQRLARLVADHMGGVVCDPESMSVSYQNLSSHLRASSGSIAMPLGRIKFGLARHRALLFKVLADSLNIPCRLVKGREYTGSDDGALNIVKFNDGREYIVDLMADPGTLIPSDGAGLAREYDESFFADYHFNKDDNSTQLGSSLSGVSSSAGCSIEYELLDKRSMPSNVRPADADRATTGELSIQGTAKSSSPQEPSVGPCTSEMTIVYEPGTTDNTVAAKTKEKSVATNNALLRTPSCTEARSFSAVRRMRVKDVSEYMINAAKENPQLAQKLHDVLLESGVVAPPDLFSELSMEQPKDLIVHDTALFETKDEMKKRKNELAYRGRADCGHGPLLPYLPGHELQPKLVASRTPPDPLKPVEGLGLYHSSDSRGSPSSSLSQNEAQNEASAPPVQEAPLQLMKQMPVAAAVATAAVVASSMVVAAAKSNSDIKFEVPVAAAATVTAAAVVASTAAVSKQYENLEPSNQLLNLSCSSEGVESPRKAREDFWDRQQLEIDHGNDNSLEQEKDLAEAPHQVERISDKSTGTESAKSDIALDDVAEFEIQWEEITLGERIGLGSFGEVYRGEWHGTEVAVKKFLHQDIPSDVLEEFRTEVRIMKRLRHPNVVLFMGAVTRVPNLSIVTEFLPRGSLFRLIHRPNNQLDERKRLRMALDVARGMNYLHNCTPIVVHRDLKSPNLLVDKNWVVKVCDFGLSRMKHNTFLSSRSTAGTAEWMAPEVLRNEPSDEKCDVFSFGVILWELCTLQQPWEGMNPMQVVGAVGFQHRRLDIPDDMDSVIADIIKKCWQTDPKMRPSFSEIMTVLKPLLKNMAHPQVPRQRVPPTNEQEKGDL